MDGAPIAGLTLVLKGATLGFSIAAPVGPIGVLCIRRCLARGVGSGLLTGLGAASADAIYGAIAAFGLTAVTAALVAHRHMLGILGGLFLCYLGFRTLFARAGPTVPGVIDHLPPHLSAGEESDRSLTGVAAYSSTLFLTLANPMTILSFIAIFASLGLAASTNYRQAMVFVAGVFIGSALWWLLLSVTIGALRHTLSPRFVRILNTLAGLVVLGFGLFAVATSVR